MILPWGCLLLEGGLLGYMAYRYVDTGSLVALVCAIFIFGCYTYCGILIIRCMRLNNDIKETNKRIVQLKESIAFYTSYSLCEDEEGEEWKV